MSLFPIIVPELSSSHFSDGLCKQREALQARTNELAEMRSRVLQDARQFEQNLIDEFDEDVSDFEPKAHGGEIFAAVCLKESRVGLLEHEMSIGRDLKLFFDDLRIEIADVTRKVSENLKKVEVEINADLISIGFLCPIENKLSPSRVLPGYVRSNLRFVKAYNEQRQWRVFSNGSYETQNRKAIEAIQDEMRQLREKLIKQSGIGAVA